MTAAETTRYTVSTVCFRRYGLAQALATAEGLGFDMVDLVGLRGLCEHVPVNGSRGDMRDAADVFQASGLRSASVNADPGSFDGFDDYEDVMRRAELLIEFAADTGSPLLVLPAGEKTEHRDVDPEISRMASGLNAAASRAKRSGVRLAVEAPYFGRPVDRVALAMELVEELDPAVELAFDVSHIEAADESVVGAWGLLAPHVGIVHFRDAVSGDIRRVIGAGRVDFGGVLDAMAATGFGGEVVLELETRNSPYATKEDEVTAAIDYLRSIRPGDAAHPGDSA